jgi:hypothetical protein
MNTVNRIIVVALLALATILCCVLLVGARWVVPALADQLSLMADLLESTPGYQVVVPGVILAFVVDFVLVLLIILEVRRPKAKFIRVEKTAGGEADISIASIASQLEQEMDALPGVLKVKPRVSGSKGGVAITMQVDVAAGFDSPAQADQIAEAARKVVAEKMGLKITDKPKVSLRAVPHPKEARPGERPRHEEGRPSFPDVPSAPAKLGDSSLGPSGKDDGQG